ncbi:hypothetical protein [Fodinicola feengrottensis]|uniref:hypothetical protein n=1 Tax=Fodinicola feengrottensis TaxID=435914 RepID=UPI0024435D96|nr:hypothetical protein [Fodinicola feengrottensis]
MSMPPTGADLTPTEVVGDLPRAQVVGRSPWQLAWLRLRARTVGRWLARSWWCCSS